MLQLTKESFEKEVIKSKIPVIVDFFADWCGPCKMMAPVFESVSKNYTNKIKFAKINVDGAGDLAEKYEVRGIPCLVIFKAGKEADRITGFVSEDELKEKLDSFA